MPHLTTTIDPSEMFDAYRKARTALSTDVHRAMLDVVIAHFEAELVTCDIDALMGTLSAAPVYKFFGIDNPDLVGRDVIRTFYEASFLAGPAQSAITRVDRVVVGDAAVVIEGGFRSLKSRALHMFPIVSTTFDADRDWLLEKDLCVVYPFDEMKISGENIYFDGNIIPGDVRYLDDL